MIKFDFKSGNASGLFGIPNERIKEILIVGNQACDIILTGDRVRFAGNSNNILKYIVDNAKPVNANEWLYCVATFGRIIGFYEAHGLITHSSAINNASEKN